MAPPKTKSDTPNLKVFRVDPAINLPKFATEQSACFDLAANWTGKDDYKGYNSNNGTFARPFGSHNVIKIMPGDRVLVPTGMILDIPEGYSVRVHARSGLSLKQGLVLANQEGVIDSDYIEELYVLLVNTGDTPQIINSGDRIAQAEMVPVLSYEVVETKKVPTLKTSRNGGLGSTGVSDVGSEPAKADADVSTAA
jgi:dUTP pyrophosphatase